MDLILNGLVITTSIGVVLFVLWVWNSIRSERPKAVDYEEYSSYDR